MALSEDQKAMLRLLAQREQGYDDLAALMGLSVEEVRVRVGDALSQLEAEGEEAPEAPHSEPAASEEEPPPPPEPEVPKSGAAAPEPAAAAAPKGPSGNRSRLSLPKDRGARAAIGAGLLAVVALVVVLIVGGGGSDEGASSPAAAGGGAGTAAAASGESGLTATLSPVDGGDAQGRAIFGRIKKNLALQVEATGLEPSPKGSAYTIWLYKSPKLALRIGAVDVDRSGNIAVQLPIPTELLSYVASGAFDQIDVALTENAAYAAEVARAKKAKQLPAQVGESVLRGKIEGSAVR